MATKNQIAHNLWITDVIRIARTISSIQNCLSDGSRCRVGVSNMNKQSRAGTGRYSFYLADKGHIVTA
ncbi:MAG: hypothetical protein LBI03_01905 [Clostridiales bacterium]|nr:hypothetical protein [Clostridiales bacterium]